MKIHFHANNKSYLPELNAYRLFLEGKGHSVDISEHIDQQADVDWFFCGTPENIRSNFVVHEFASASIPPYAFAKNFYKKWLTPKPNYRIFLNSTVKQKIGFNDQTPYEFRDMGVPKSFFQIPRGETLFDWVYLGEMSRIEYFEENIKSLGESNHKVLFIGEPPSAIHKILKKYSNFSITGKIEQHEVQTLLSQCRAGLNLMPLTPPYTFQASTKVLEYLATGTIVITEKYEWINSIEDLSSQAIFIKKWPKHPIEWDLLRLDIPTRIPDRKKWLRYEWDQILKTMAIWKILKI